MARSTDKAMNHEALVEENKRLRAELDRLHQSEKKRRQVERRLDGCEQRFQNVSQNIAQGLYRRTAGPEGRLVMVNDAFVKMFGYDSEAELLEKPVADLYWDPSECARFSERMFRDRQVLRQEYQGRRKDNTPIWVAVTATVVHGEDEGPDYFDGIMEDITERKASEQEKELRQQQLVQADKMITLGILVSGMAHEINNPNQFIMTNLAPLKRCVDEALPILERYYQANGDFMMAGQRYTLRKQQIPEMFANIRKGSERIKNIVNELRDYAREHPTDITECIEINSIVKSALALLANLAKATAPHFEVSYANDLPPICGDYQRIEQVVINLIQNACQALPKRDGTLSVKTHFDRDQQRICVTITDNGVGISAEDLKHIKDPFFTRKRTEGGTGLGLSISSAIVEKHKGTLE